MKLNKTIFVNNQFDIVTARMRGRDIAQQMGFNISDQLSISLAISELARVLSWNTSTRGEIIISDTYQDGQRGLLIACLITLDYLPIEDRAEWRKNDSVVIRSLDGALRLVDESTLRLQNDKQAWVIMTKWAGAQ